MQDKHSEIERRRYIRLNTVFPVEFQVMDSLATQTLHGPLQGFTQDIGRGGICLAVNHLDAKLASDIIHKKVRLYLNINIPIWAKPVKALASVSWTKEIAAEPENRYLIGLIYEEISSKEKDRILNYAFWLKQMPRASLFLIAILLSSLLALFGYYLKLYLENKVMVKDFIEVLQRASIAKEELEQLKNTKQTLEAKMAEYTAKIAELESKLAQAERSTEIGQLKETISKLTEEKAILEQMISNLGKQENEITQDLLLMKEKTQKDSAQ